MQYCPECGTRVQPDVTYCHGCGEDLREYRDWAASAAVDTDDAADAGTDAGANEPSERPSDDADPDDDSTADPRPTDPASSPGAASDSTPSGSREYGTGRRAGGRSGEASTASQPAWGDEDSPAPDERPQGGPEERSPAASHEPAPAAPDRPVVDSGPSLSDRVTALPLKRSAAVGAGLAVVSYVATYIAFLVDALVVHGGDHSLGPTNLLPLTDVAQGSAQQMWELVGWLFYAGHNVPIERPTAGGGEVVAVLGEEYWTQFTVPPLVTSELYTLVPFAVIVAGGALYARSHGDATLDGGRNDFALLGASVLVGYAAVGAVGTSLFAVAEGGASTGPPLVDAVLWTSLFAGVAGAVGGVVARRFGEDAAPSGAVAGDEATGDRAAGDAPTDEADGVVDDSPADVEGTDVAAVGTDDGAAGDETEGELASAAGTPDASPDDRP
ncbi:zinc ribbon domain-containing protein [Halostella sp. JP-L12]|uniref:zinc ribbon domain-containing protein n=1 Tax=Halostella TaxID=1843185 RepID=UPI000EF813E2|nr:MULTISPECIES: zinc ribbon domain-containing protein [Halostella]NHN47065.1 zinc ribbon domain-containing protein [Halostella sp. JP-L12]